MYGDDEGEDLSDERPPPPESREGDRSASFAQLGISLGETIQEIPPSSVSPRED